MSAAANHTKSTQRLSDTQAMEQLREILLHEDRATLARLEQIIDNEEQLAEKVDPIISRHIHFLEENFPDSYHKVIKRIIDNQLKQQQDELINIIYPKLGILIRKYVRSEVNSFIKVVMERFQKTAGQNSTSFFGFKKKVSADDVIANLGSTQVEEAYVVSHESGLLLGSASASQTVDKDMIAGMLTAIKGFVKDAFRRTDDDLRGIQYGDYEILIQNFYNYYIALAISGTLSQSERDQLTSKILEFATKELNHNLQEPNPIIYARLQKQLMAYFVSPQKTALNGK